MKAEPCSGDRRLRDRRWQADRIRLPCQSGCLRLRLLRRRSDATARPIRRLRRRRGCQRPSLQRGARGLDQLAAGRVPLVGDFASAVAKTSSNAAGSSGARSESRGGGSFRWAKTTRELALAVERAPPREALEEDAAERVDVGSAVDVAALDLLRRDVVDRADEAAVRREAAGRREVPSEAEVADVRVLSFGLLADEDVRRLHVPVDEPRRVRGIEGLGDLRDDVDRALGIQSAFPPEEARAGRPPPRAPSRGRGRRLPRRRRGSERRGGDRGSPRASTPAGSAFGSARPLRDRGQAPSARSGPLASYPRPGKRSPWRLRQSVTPRGIRRRPSRWRRETTSLVEAWQANT